VTAAPKFRAGASVSAFPERQAHLIGITGDHRVHSRLGRAVPVMRGQAEPVPGRLRADEEIREFRCQCRDQGSQAARAFPGAWRVMLLAVGADCVQARGCRHPGFASSTPPPEFLLHQQAVSNARTSAAIGPTGPVRACSSQPQAPASARRAPVTAAFKVRWSGPPRSSAQADGRDRSLAVRPADN
jgi:hypothetical protein